MFEKTLKSKLYLVNSSPKDSWLIYENATNNLRVSYPLVWKRTGGENNITFISPLKNVNDSFQENIMISIMPSGNMALDESVSLALTQYKQSVNDFKLVDSRLTKIAGKYCI